MYKKLNKTKPQMLHKTFRKYLLILSYEEKLILFKPYYYNLTYYLPGGIRCSVFKIIFQLYKNILYKLRALVSNSSRTSTGAPNIATESLDLLNNAHFLLRQIWKLL